MGLGGEAVVVEVYGVNDFYSVRLRVLGFGLAWFRLRNTRFEWWVSELFYFLFSKDGTGRSFFFSLFDTFWFVLFFVLYIYM